MTIRKRRDENGHMRGAGEYSQNYAKFDRPEPHDDGAKIDRFNVVTDNAEANGGFAAPLSPPDTPPRKISQWEGSISRKPR